MEDSGKNIGKPSFNESLTQAFSLAEKDWKQYSPLTLAYLGDAVYELAVRTVYVKRMNCQAHKLNRLVVGHVSAKNQCRLVRTLLPMLSEEEYAVYKRGRNAKPASMAKNASTEEYLEATGFEALIGYLYLEERFDRMQELIRCGFHEEEAGAAVTDQK